MFRITNIQTRQQETCDSRDELLSIVNEKSVWAEDRKESFQLQIEQLTEDQSLLDSMSLAIPFQSIVEEALDGFGLKREKKGFSFLLNKKSNSTVSEKNSSQKETDTIQSLSKKAGGTEEQEQKIQVKQNKRKTEETTKDKNNQDDNTQVNLKKEVIKKTRQKTSLNIFSQLKNIFSSNEVIWKILTVIALMLSFSLLVTVHSQTKTVQSLKKSVKLDKNQGKIEVVGRFFIANYYSGNDNQLSDFLSKDLKAEGVKSKKDERVESTIYESLSKTSKEKDKMTFVVTTKDKDDHIKTIRLILTFSKDSNSDYGYVLVAQPKISSFNE